MSDLVNRKKVLFHYMIGGTAGGSDTCLFLLLKYLDQTKFEPYLLFNSESKYTKELKEKGIKLIPLPKHIVPKKKTISYKFTKKNNNISNKQPSNIRLFLGSIKHLIKRVPEIIRYAKVIKKYGVDIVHVNHYLTGDRSMILASLLMGKTIVSHNRGLYKPDYIDKYISKHLDQIICMSDFSKSVYTDNGVPEKKCKTIYDGIEIDQIYSTEIETKPIIISCIGRLEKWKGQQVLIEAAKTIVKTNSEIKIIFVGNGNDEDELKSKVKNNGLEKYIEFTGHITNVNDYINKSSIIVHTSIEPEPFGMVIIEAMVLEKPVIATNFGGPMEIIDNGKDGYLIPAQNPNILAEHIIKLIENPALRIQIGKSAREKVISKFDVKDYAKQIENIYNDVNK